MNRSAPRCYVIKGTSGSGKSTLAQRLSPLLELPVVDLDLLFHGPDGNVPSGDAFRATVASVLDGIPHGWIVDGNHDGYLGDLVIGRAEMIIWLDLPLGLKFVRLFRRSLHRIVRRVDLGNGFRETWRSQFASRDSIFADLVSKHRRHRRIWPNRFADDPRLVRLRSDCEIERWLDGSKVW